MEYALDTTFDHYDGKLRFHFLPAHCGHHLNPIEVCQTQPILHAAIDETFLCVRRATGNKEMFDASPMTCTAVKD